MKCFSLILKRGNDFWKKKLKLTNVSEKDFSFDFNVNATCGTHRQNKFKYNKMVQGEGRNKGRQKSKLCRGLELINSYSNG